MHLGVLFHERVTFLKEFIFQLMTGNFSSLFNLREARPKWSVSLTWSLAGKIPTFDFPEAVYIILKLQ